MNRYHSKRGPVEGCPQRDTNPIASGSVVQATTREQRRAACAVSMVGEGSPLMLHSQEFIAAERARIARLVPGWQA